MVQDKQSETIYAAVTVTAVVIGVYFSSQYSNLLFHGLVEVISIVIAFSLFILVLNTHAYMENNYLRLIGIGYAFSALIDLFHTFAFKGMNVFAEHESVWPAQLWLAARYLQTITLLIAPLLIKRSPGTRVIFGGYTAVAAALLTLIFSGHFPDCLIEGRGLTPFKKGSEYVISGFLMFSLYLLSRKRSHFSDKIYWLIVASVSCTIVSELCFTSFVSMYDFTNKLGHIAKLVAFYLLYRAILVTGLKEPFEVVFRTLKQTEQELLNHQETLENRIRERTAELAGANSALLVEIAERKRAEEALHLQAAELEEEVAERQVAQESLQEKALLLEEEIEKRQEAQEKLERVNESLEERVRERTADLMAKSNELAEKHKELERFNRLFVNRELRMVELKERIRELEGKTAVE